MAAAGIQEVVVWEWLDDSDMWLPYASHVSNYIELEYRSSSNMATSLVITLARIDPAYHLYEVDTANKIQINTHTGFCRQVRRALYTSPSPLAEGIIWEWNSKPNICQPYSSDIAEQLESAYSKHILSLMVTIAGCQYHIDLKYMTQTNQTTGFRRQIYRQLLTTQYLANNTPSSTTYQKQDISTSQHLSSANIQLESDRPNSAASIGLVESFTTKVAKPEDDDCPICCEKLSNLSEYDSQDSIVLQLSRCKHQYHRACLLQMYKAGNENGSFQCPVCKCIYGLKVGNCPPGTIKVETLPTSLPGYPNCGTIVITYNISSGVQRSDHPNPGKPFTARGFPRTGYLPDNTQGRKVSRLLQEAWKRRLTFTIGTSSTTGEQDTVVWNEIHHKTSIDNYSGHGYPDPNYLDNVLKELELQGVVDG